MNIQKKASTDACRSALAAAFPEIESFYSFVHDNDDATVHSIINLA
jgi:uncharacterized protein Usg